LIQVKGRIPRLRQKKTRINVRRHIRNKAKN
jgi:hypothetical protein